MRSTSTPLSSHKNSLPSVIDLFSGCGGMSLGFQLAGFNAREGFDNWTCAASATIAKRLSRDKNWTVRESLTRTFNLKVDDKTLTRIRLLKS